MPNNATRIGRARGPEMRNNHRISALHCNDTYRLGSARLARMMRPTCGTIALVCFVARDALMSENNTVALALGAKTMFKE